MDIAVVYEVPPQRTERRFTLNSDATFTLRSLLLWWGDDGSWTKTTHLYNGNYTVSGNVYTLTQSKSSGMIPPFVYEITLNGDVATVVKKTTFLFGPHPILIGHMVPSAG
jgi:hypothetical protein